MNKYTPWLMIVFLVIWLFASGFVVSIWNPELRDEMIPSRSVQLQASIEFFALGSVPIIIITLIYAYNERKDTSPVTTEKVKPNDN